MTNPKLAAFYARDEHIKEMAHWFYTIHDSRGIDFGAYMNFDLEHIKYLDHLPLNNLILFCSLSVN